MTDSRITILNNIKQALRTSSPVFRTADRIDLPSMHWSNDVCLKQFIEKAERAHSTVIQANSKNEIMKHILAIVGSEGPIITATTDLLNNLDWSPIQDRISHNPLDANEHIAISEACCGIAETGTLVMRSSQSTPTTLNFLPITEIVCLSTQTLYGCYEQAWPHITNQKSMPRCINFVTGPSCTGDIEQEILWGAHGPKQLYIILYSN